MRRAHTRDTVRRLDSRRHEMWSETLRLAEGQSSGRPENGLTRSEHLLLKSHEFEITVGRTPGLCLPVAILHDAASVGRSSIEVTQQTLQAESDQRIVMVDRGARLGLGPRTRPALPHHAFLARTAHSDPGNGPARGDFTPEKNPFLIRHQSSIALRRSIFVAAFPCHARKPEGIMKKNLKSADSRRRDGRPLLVTVATATEAVAATAPTVPGPESSPTRPGPGAAAGERRTSRPNGSVDVTFAAAQPSGAHRPERRGHRSWQPCRLTTDGGVHTAVLGFPLTTGLVRTDDGTLYVLYATGTTDLTGLWRLKTGAQGRRNGSPHSRAERPAQRTCLRSPLAKPSTSRTRSSAPYGESPRTADGDGLVDRTGAGRTRDSSEPMARRCTKATLWVTNLDRGTVLSSPSARTAAREHTGPRATGLEGIDDFAFTGRGNEILAALNGPGTVVRIADDGSAHHRPGLRPTDGGGSRTCSRRWSGTYWSTPRR